MHDVDSTTPVGGPTGSPALACALNYVDLGWRVIPIKPGTKHPSMKGWPRLASNDAAQVKQWYEGECAGWGVGLALGRESGVFAVDIDPRNDGELTLLAWEWETGLTLPPTLTNRTGGGGWHYIYRYPQDARVGNNATALAEWSTRDDNVSGVEVKSDGTQIVLPPSIHPETGLEYAWLDLSTEPAEMSTEVLEALLGRVSLDRSGVKTYGSAGGLSDAQRQLYDAIVRDGSTVPAGFRDVFFNARAFSLRRAGRARDDVLGDLHGHWRRTEQTYEDEYTWEMVVAKVDRVWETVDVEVLPEWGNATLLHGAGDEGKRPRLRPAGDWILDEPDEIPGVWGKGEEVLWAEGESFMLAGIQGAGKTTIAQQLVLARVGVREPTLLGLPVNVDDRPVLYLAMDRPRQAARSFGRMVAPRDRAALNERLLVWTGPLAFDPTKDHRLLAEFVESQGAGLVVVDSVKDLAPGISDDKVGAALNQAWQEVIARGIELLLLHHERKKQQGTSKAHSLDDVYGSAWLTAGCGSVATLVGEPGDAIVEMRHLKQPVGVVGPLTVHHDHARGESGRRAFTATTWDVLCANPDGVTMADIAREVYGRDTTNDRKRVERELKALKKKGHVESVEGAHTGHGREPNRWLLTAEARWARDNGGEVEA